FLVGVVFAPCLQGRGGWGRVWEMEFLDKMEKKMGWLSFPGLLKYYALFHVMVFLLQVVNPEIRQVLSFDKSLIFAGEYWRVITFPFADGGGQVGAFAMLFLFFMVMIAFMMNDALEGAWGVFRVSVFLYLGYFALLFANFVFPVPLPGAGFFIYTSAFFAFATLFPKHEFLMFLVIPVQVRWLAILLAVMTVVSAVSFHPVYFIYVVLSFLNYILFAGIPALKGKARVVKAVGWRKKFEGSKTDPDSAFHKCEECGRTEVSDRELEFRMAEDGKEYCVDHLKE
ncbi:MAG: hypothetical protein ACSHX7_13185, partial [Luteolibacter sp.]